MLHPVVGLENDGVRVGICLHTERAVQVWGFDRAHVIQALDRCVHILASLDPDAWMGLESKEESVYMYISLSYVSLNTAHLNAASILVTTVAIQQ